LRYICLKVLDSAIQLVDHVNGLFFLDWVRFDTQKQELLALGVKVRKKAVAPVDYTCFEVLQDALIQMLVQVLLVSADQELSLLEVKCDHKASCHKAYHHHVNHHQRPFLLD
jgi:hypothetical protein